MKTQTLGWLVGLGAAGCSFMSCTQPATECQVGLAGYLPYIAVYTPMGAPTPAMCEMTSPGVVQGGDLIGMEFFHPATADGTTYDDTKATVAIKSDSIGEEVNKYAGFACAPAACAGNCGPVADGCGGLALDPMAPATQLDCGPCTKMGETCGGGGPSVCGTKTCTPATCADLKANCGPAGDGCGGMLDCGSCADPADTCGGNGIPSVCGHVTLDATNVPYALGNFAQQFPDAKNMCQVNMLAPAEQDFASGPAMSPALPVNTVKYAWSNVNVYVTAATQGSQFSADMTYTENGCSASYHVVGLWPAVDCTDTTTDMMGNITAQAPNQDACNPCAQPDKMIFVGSGISPDFPVTCKKVLPAATDMSPDPWGRDPYWCVFDSDGDPPKLNPNPPTCNATTP